jgi:hypothetical protein
VPSLLLRLLGVPLFRLRRVPQGRTVRASNFLRRPSDPSLTFCDRGAVNELLSCPGDPGPRSTTNDTTHRQRIGHLQPSQPESGRSSRFSGPGDHRRANWPAAYLLDLFASTNRSLSSFTFLNSFVSRFSASRSETMDTAAETLVLPEVVSANDQIALRQR